MNENEITGPQSIIAEGDMFSGYAFHGPFDDHESAIEWAEFNLRKSDWVVATMQAPS